MVILAFAATVAAIVIIGNIPEAERKFDEESGHWCINEGGKGKKGFRFIAVLRLIRILRLR